MMTDHEPICYELTGEGAELGKMITATAPPVYSATLPSCGGRARGNEAS